MKKKELEGVKPGEVEIIEADPEAGPGEIPPEAMKGGKGNE